MYIIFEVTNLGTLLYIFTKLRLYSIGTYTLVASLRDIYNLFVNHNC